VGHGGLVVDADDRRRAEAEARRRERAYVAPPRAQPRGSSATTSRLADPTTTISGDRAASLID
jgi:hypothetical protein